MARRVVIEALFRRRGWVTSLGYLLTFVLYFVVELNEPSIALRTLLFFVMAGWLGPFLLWQYGIVTRIIDAPSSVPGRRASWLSGLTRTSPLFCLAYAVAAPLPEQSEVPFAVALFIVVTMPMMFCLSGLIWMNAKALAEPIPEQHVPRGDPVRWTIGLFYFPLCIPQLNARFRLADRVKIYRSGRVW